MIEVSLFHFLRLETNHIHRFGIRIRVARADEVGVGGIFEARNQSG